MDEINEIEEISEIDEIGEIDEIDEIDKVDENVGVNIFNEIKKKPTKLKKMTLKN